MSAELSEIMLLFHRLLRQAQSDVDAMTQLACISHSNASQCYIELKRWRAAAREATCATFSGFFPVDFVVDIITSKI
jgi:hypothetical protein